MEGIKVRQIKWHPKTKKLSQIPDEGLEYALVSDNYEQIHQLVWCKDFIQDAIHGYLNNSVSKIYGFSYDPAQDLPVSMKRTRIIVANWKDYDLGEKIVNRVLPLLHEVEDRLNMARTVVERGADTPIRYKKSGFWLFDSSIRWSKSPPMISLFTMLIRIGLVRNLKDKLEKHITKIKNGDVECYFSVEGQQDRYQVRRAEKGIKKILDHGDRKIFHPNIRRNYPPLYQDKIGAKSITMSTIHDGCGIGAFSDGDTKFLFPYWHRLDGDKK